MRKRTAEIYLPVFVNDGSEKNLIGLFLINNHMEDQFNDLCLLEKRPNIDFHTAFCCTKVNIIIFFLLPIQTSDLNRTERFPEAYRVH